MIIEGHWLPYLGDWLRFSSLKRSVTGYVGAASDNYFLHSKKPKLNNSPNLANPRSADNRAPLVKFCALLFIKLSYLGKTTRNSAIS